MKAKKKLATHRRTQAQHQGAVYPGPDAEACAEVLNIQRKGGKLFKLDGSERHLASVKLDPILGQQSRLLAQPESVLLGPCQQS